MESLALAEVVCRGACCGGFCPCATEANIRFAVGSLAAVEEEGPFVLANRSEPWPDEVEELEDVE